jgi:hypothetical protein
VRNGAASPSDDARRSDVLGHMPECEKRDTQPDRGIASSDLGSDLAQRTTILVDVGVSESG